MVLSLFCYCEALRETNIPDTASFQSFSPIADVMSHVKLVRVRPYRTRFQATYNHPGSSIWAGDEVESEMFFLRRLCLILLTCSVSISFLAPCLSKVKFIFVVVTNACYIYFFFFFYIYGAFIKYLKALFSYVCFVFSLTVKLCFKTVVKVKKANGVIIRNYI